MGKLLRTPLPHNLNTYATGTWTATAGTSSEPAHNAKAAADTTSTITVPVALPAEYDLVGAKLLAIHIPMLVGTADLDAVITGNLYRNNMWKAVQVPAQTFTANIDTNVLTLATAALRVGQPVTLTTSGALPTGLATSTTYYVGNVSGLTCQLFTTQAAAYSNSGPIGLTAAGSGTHTMTCPTIDVSTIGMTLSGTQVAFSANARRLVATVDAPAFENVDQPSLADLFSYTFNFSVNAGASTVVKVYSGFALWESTAV